MVEHLPLSLQGTALVQFFIEDLSAQKEFEWIQLEDMIQKSLSNLYLKVASRESDST